jgi:hypothetical protein
MRMRKKKRAACVAVDPERLSSELQSPDETVRAKTVRSLCPCHAGWGAFERLIGDVSRLTQDNSPAVRAHALHVYEDAVKMQSLEDSAHRLEAVEEALGRKRAAHSGGGEAGFRVRRSGTVKRRRGGFVLR